MAQTRLLDRLVSGNVIAPSAETAVMALRRARQAPDADQRARTMQLLDTLWLNCHRPRAAVGS